MLSIASMQLNTAIQLISNKQIDKTGISQWADLGAGQGLFTQALSTLLAPGSKIYAVDKIVQQIKPARNSVAIDFVQADFITDDLALPMLNGVLMANALHFVRDKPALIARLKNYLLPQAGFIIVEYAIEKANRWVPYPVSIAELKELFAAAGYDYIEKTGEVDSVYNEGKIYACSINKLSR
jgi:trans-aconitate methyltransferase